MAIRKAKWPCSSCGTINDGSETICCQCGSPREDHERPIFSTEDPVVTNPEELAKANAGSHLTCGHCGANSPRGTTQCPGCGNPIDSEDKERPVEKVVQYSPSGDSSPVFGQSRTPGTVARLDIPEGKKTPAVSLMEREMEGNTRRETSPSGLRTTNLAALLRRILVPASVVIGLALLVWVIYFFFFDTHEEYGVVRSVSWSRGISVERLNTEIQEDWSVPFEGRLLSSREKQRSTREVVIGINKKTCKVQGNRRDLGNGYYDDGVKEVDCSEKITRTEPVMDTWYTYEIDVWRHHRSVVTSGQGFNPYWGEVQLGYRERRGGSTEKYVLHIQNSSEEAAQGREYVTSNIATWQSFPPGTAVTMDVNRVSSVLAIRRR